MTFQPTHMNMGNKLSNGIDYVNVQSTLRLVFPIGTRLALDKNKFLNIFTGNIFGNAISRGLYVYVKYGPPMITGDFYVFTLHIVVYVGMRVLLLQ